MLFSAAMLALLPCDGPTLSWEHKGPAGYYNLGDKAKATSAGAAQAATLINGTTWLISTANGGIWKTEDVTALPEPHWKAVLDDQPVRCTSVSAMASHGSTVVAGCGAATSSEMGYTWDVANTGDFGGVMASSDGGDTWAMTPFPANYYVSAVIVLSPTSHLIGARSQLFNRTDGGVWLFTNNQYAKVFETPVFDLRLEPSSRCVLAAIPWGADSEAAYAACDGSFTSWQPFAQGIDWGEERKPFYPTLAIGAEVVFLGALTVNAKNLSDTHSGLWVRPLSELRALAIAVAAHEAAPAAGWKAVTNAPRLDEDGMPKDRMALLVHPHNDSMLFVAGNAGALTWRVDWQTGTWTESFGKDTADDSEPHGDCRTYAWEPTTSSLILLNDGGAHLREMPAEHGGRWRTLTGDSGAMEFISAEWEPVSRSWVAGAQDNTVQLSPPNTTATSRAIGYVFGDGTVVAIDRTTTPPRYYGATQFLGNVLDDDAGPSRQSRRTRRQLRAKKHAHPSGGHPGYGDVEKEEDEDGNEDEGNEEHYGFAFATMDAVGGISVVGIPLLDWFDVNMFPFFDHPFALNTAAPTATSGEALPLVVWARAGRGRPSGFYRIDTSNATNLARAKAPFGAGPSLDVTTDGDVYVFVSGGKTNGQPDASVLVGMNDTHLLHRSALSKGVLISQRLPTIFARPIEFAYTSPNAYILGPVSHDRTVSLAVSPTDSNLVAVTGWPSDLQGFADEKVYLSVNRGETWNDLTTGLLAASGVCVRPSGGKCGRARPSALLLLPLPNGDHALLVGTVNGVLASRHFGPWRRLGGCTELPLVLVAGLSYEASSDTLVAATMGRGVYIVEGAAAKIQKILYEE